MATGRGSGGHGDGDGEVRQRGDGTVLAALRPCGGEDAIGAERLAAGSREGEACHACRGR